MISRSAVRVGDARALFVDLEPGLHRVVVMDDAGASHRVEYRVGEGRAARVVRAPRCDGGIGPGSLAVLPIPTTRVILLAPGEVAEWLKALPC